MRVVLGSTSEHKLDAVRLACEKLGGDATDPHSTLTHGKVSRKDILAQALMIALSQL